MTKKFIDELVEISFDGSDIDETTVQQIVSKLKRRELKAYIRTLRAKILKHTVTIISPHELSQKAKKQFSDTYADKMLRFTTDPSSLLGVKIIANDIVYDSTLKGEFDQIRNSMRE